MNIRALSEAAGENKIKQRFFSYSKNIPYIKNRNSTAAWFHPGLSLLLILQSIGNLGKIDIYLLMLLNRTDNACEEKKKKIITGAKKRCCCIYRFISPARIQHEM